MDKGRKKGLASLAVLLITISTLGVLYFHPPAEAMSIEISTSRKSNFKTPATAVFRIDLKISQVEMVPILSLEAVITGIGTPNPVSVTSPDFPPNKARTDLTAVSPFVRAVSGSGFTTHFFSSLYGFGGQGFQSGYGSGGSGYGFGAGTNHYRILVSTSRLAKLAGLTRTNTGEFKIQIKVITSLSPTSVFTSNPVSFTVQVKGEGEPDDQEEAHGEHHDEQFRDDQNGVSGTFNAMCDEGECSIGTADYGDNNPGGAPLPGGVSGLRFVDVQFNGFNQTGTVTVTIFVQGLDSVSNPGLYFWDGDSWVGVSSSRSGNTITGTFGVSDLSGTPVAVVALPVPPPPPVTTTTTTTTTMSKNSTTTSTGTTSRTTTSTSSRSTTSATSTTTTTSSKTSTTSTTPTISSTSTSSTTPTISSTTSTTAKSSSTSRTTTTESTRTTPIPIGPNDVIVASIAGITVAAVVIVIFASRYARAKTQAG